MDEISGSLILAAGTIGLVHTLAGPDHYLPFVAMARAGGWSLRRTIVVTWVCGVGHLSGSVALAGAATALGIGLAPLRVVEETRGDWAAWLLTGFGLAYLIWGVRRGIRNRPHSHVHAHCDGTIHRHAHVHADDHFHVHEVNPPGRPSSGHALDTDHGERIRRTSLTPWVLFIVFLLGPCEVLIPLLMVPAARGDLWTAASMVLLFGFTTLLTMTAAVTLGYWGLKSLRGSALERYGHAGAGAVALGCGVAVMLGM